MKKLVKSYKKIEKDIRAIEYFLYLVVSLLTVQSIVYFYLQRHIDGLRIIGQLGILISALLAVKVVNRLLIYSNYIRKDDTNRNTAIMKNYLLSVINDLMNRVHWAEKIFFKGDHSPVAFVRHIAVLEKRYDLFFDKKIYKYLNAEAIELIWRMSGSICGLTTLSKSMDDINKQNIEMPADNQLEIKTHLNKLKTDLELLDDQVRNVKIPEIGLLSPKDLGQEE